jgi:hypothetical protein
MGILIEKGSLVLLISFSNRYLSIFNTSEQFSALGQMNLAAGAIKHLRL